MSLLLILMLSGLVSVWSQSTLLDSQCDGHCRNIEIHRLIAIMENMERIMHDTNERSEKKIMELESKLDKLKTDQESKIESKIDRIQELDQKEKIQKNTINQLQTKVSELESITSEDCEDIRALGYQTSGVYSVNAGNGQTKRVYCEMTSRTVWTRILHRQDNLTDFTFKKWADYEAGFGDPQGSHWMGLVQMHQLTNSRKYKMRVDLMDFKGKMRYAEYSMFRVDGGSSKYRLRISGYSGTAGDSMDYGLQRTYRNNNMMFTTIDSDNDRWSDGNCAGGIDPDTGGAEPYYLGGWWYSKCRFGALTGYYGRVGRFRYGISWGDWMVPIKVAIMKIQRQ